MPLPIIPGVKPPWITESGGVASEHPVASKLGVDVLSLGGNAIDATITTSLALALTQPHLGGLGGDFFAMIYTAREGRVYFLNASGWAPKGLSRELLRQRGLNAVPLRGPLSPVVPGLLAGLHALWKRFGSNEWRSLVKPVVDAARGGFPVGPSFVKAIELVKNEVANDSDFKTVYPINAKPWDLIRIEPLIKTLELIMEHGPDVLYRGEVGEALVNYVQSRSGVMEMSDLMEYEPEWRDPLSIDYKGLTIYESPPNTQGVTTLMILKLLEYIRDTGDPWSRRRIETYLGAYRVAYELRDRYVGDPRFIDAPINKLLDPDFLLSEFKSRYGNRQLGASGDTTYFVIVDKEGNVVSAIQSLYQHFGSLVTEPRYGITLNDRASDFSMDGPNALMPRKRPLHTLSAVIITKDGEPRYALGTSGAHFRPQQHTLFITNIIDYGLSPVEAIDAPRFLWDRKSLTIEEGYEVTGLTEPHQVIKYPGRTGVASIAAFLNGGRKLLYADIRGDGLALGQ
ncbi:gamma-glutamyltransferase family protein [Vulcanisaeta souniana]|uniref:Gamma-glutamyltransferase n=1 Tax=Vulcanisaeta souniana JCM 11219 TaxID=1293586 RepID=A0A830EG41_9CREN|nr:gamma-glutamyltransferase family protein [Vulcanisaeta souniana]BDR90940.1 gamma-glutamyltransferase [Vulcanisaeta souniana JCM 11219]GGI79469.1 gamma-glutamyltransferase [Vulcanisaeta souniana JCM 11219]